MVEIKMVVLNNDYREYQLDNGLAVVLQNTPTQTIAGKLRVNFGAYHEKPEEKGLAHFLEHCLVSGGSKKYTPEQSDKIRKNLGYFNARTKVGITYFYVNILQEDFGQWLDFISDSIFNPRFDTKRFEGEKKRVLREILDEKSNPLFKQSKGVESEFYRGHPKGIFVLGDENVINQTDINKLREFYSKGYHPNNMDLILVGNLSPNTEQLIKRYFGRYKKGKNTRTEFPELKPLDRKIISHQNNPNLYNKEKPEESSAFINLNVLTAPAEHTDSSAIRALSYLLGISNDSRLYRSLGLEEGLAYNVSSSYNGDYNVGVLNIQAMVPAIRLEEAVNIIFNELYRLKKEKIDEEELKNVRKAVKFSIATQFETNLGHIGIIESWLDYKITPESFIKGFDSLDAEKMKEVANKYLPDREKGKYVLCIGDPLKED